MKAVDFYNNIVKIKKEFEHVDRASLDFFVSHSLTGINITPKTLDEAYVSENEIENLIRYYTLGGIGYLINDISLYDPIVKTDNDLYIFGAIDGYLCYDKNLRISWNDEVQLKEMSVVATSPECFLDVIYSLAHNNIYQELSTEDLCKKVIYLSGDNETKLFYNYLLGFI